METEATDLVSAGTGIEVELCVSEGIAAEGAFGWIVRHTMETF
jgi:hypothetical protein